jgi:hypothetical protein
MAKNDGFLYTRCDAENQRKTGHFEGPAEEVFGQGEKPVQGIETVNMIRRGQVKWLKDDIAGQAARSSDASLG